VNKFLLAYVILCKHVYFRQYFACLRERIFNCGNVLLPSWSSRSNSSGYLRRHFPSCFLYGDKISKEYKDCDTNSQLLLWKLSQLNKFQCSQLRIKYGLFLSRIIIKYCELVKLCHINHSGLVFLRRKVDFATAPYDKIPPQLNTTLISALASSLEAAASECCSSCGRRKSDSVDVANLQCAVKLQQRRNMWASVDCHSRP